MTVHLETERLLLRQFTPDDVDAVVELDSDPEVMFFITGGRATPRDEVRDEVLPAIQAGSWGVFVPHPLTWMFEHVEPPLGEPRFRELVHLGELPELLEKIGSVSV